jgi:hypothetical protein
MIERPHAGYQSKKDFTPTAMVTTAAAFWRTTFQSTGCGGAMYRVGTSSTLGCLALMLGNDTIIVPSFLLGAVIPEKKRVASWRPSSNSTVVKNPQLVNRIYKFNPKVARLTS